MGYIKEPKGVDLVVGAGELTEEDTIYIRQAIAAYKKNKAKIDRVEIGSYLGKAYKQGSYVARPQTLSIKANDGKVHLFKVSPAASKALPHGIKKRKNNNFL